MKPYYARRAPEAWHHLSAYATELNAGQRSITRLQQLYDGVDRLDDEQLESNRYYGIGLVMCGIARALQQSHVRRETVDWAARNAATSQARLYGDAHFMPEVLVGDGVLEPFSKLAKSASNDLSPPDYLLVNTLIAITQRRQNAARGQDNWAARDSLRQDQWLVSILEGKPAVDLIGANATSATSHLITRAIRLPAFEVMFGPEHHIMDTGTGMLKVTKEVLSSLNLRSVAYYLAALRLDEFRPTLKTLEFEKGEFVIDRTALSREPTQESLPTPSKQALLHKARLKCPAIHVQGLIPLMLEIVPEILLKAQDNLDWLRRHNAII